MTCPTCLQLCDPNGPRDPNGPLRMYIALKLLRAWSGMHGSYAFSADVVYIVNTWLDGGMKGRIPWPDNPFFAEWAEKNGYSNVGGNVGFILMAEMVEP